MLILSNAIKSITRSKGRNLLLGIIVVTVAAAACVALSIKNTADKMEKSGLSELSVTASIGVDRSKLAASMQGGATNGGRPTFNFGNPLSLDEYKLYAESDQVKNFYYTATDQAYKTDDGVQPFSSSDSAAENEPQMPQGGGFVMSGRGLGDFQISAVSGEDAMSDFLSGGASITSGDMFGAGDDTCIISEELAAFNGLAVGDTFDILLGEEKDITLTLKISGIYANTSSEDSAFGGRMGIDPGNRIYLGADSLLAVSETATISAAYALADADALTKFESDARAMGLSDDYSVTSNDIRQYENSIVPLKNTGKFAITMLIVVLAVGGLILIALNILNIRERKYEVGVLTAIGINKTKVAAQFAAELLIVTMASIIIGTGIGAVASAPVASSLMSSQLEAAQTGQNNRGTAFGRQPDGGAAGIMPGNMGGGPVSIGFPFGSAAGYVSEINAAVDVVVLLQLLLIGLALSVAASVAAIVFVMRYEPLKILANRS